MTNFGKENIDDYFVKYYLLDYLINSRMFYILCSRCLGSRFNSSIGFYGVKHASLGA